MAKYGEIFNSANVTRAWVAVLTLFGLSSLYRTDSKQYKVSYIKVLYSMLMAMALTYFLYENKQPIRKDITGSIFRISVFTSGNIVTILLIILAVINAKSGAELLSTWQNFNRKFFIQDSLSIKFFSAFLACGFLVSINVVTDYFQFVHITGAWRNLISGYLFPIYTFLTVGQFSFQMRLLQTNLELLNDGLKNFRVSFVKCSYFLPITEVDYSSREFIKLRAIYHELFMISQKITEVYSSRFILTIGEHFLIGTTYMYSAITQAFEPKPMVLPFTNAPFWISFLRWSVTSYLSILTAIYPCQDVINEQKETEIAAQHLRNKTTQTGLVREIDNFLVQIMEEKIEFAPYSLFQINNNLLLSLLGAAASYLVILNQFQFNSGMLMN